MKEKISENLFYKRIEYKDIYTTVYLIKTEKGCEVRVRKMSKYRLTTWIMHQCGRAAVNSPPGVSREIQEFASTIIKKHSPERY